MKVNVGNDLYLKGRIGWKGLSKDEYLDKSDYRIINGYSLKDGYIDWDIAGYISEDRYEESPEIKLEKNDILITKDGTIGKVGIVRNLVSPTTVA
jgi:type I restriction enzyme S subunit